MTPSQACAALQIKGPELSQLLINGHLEGAFYGLATGQIQCLIDRKSVADLRRKWYAEGKDAK